jgi:hypothetical protein
VTIRVTREYAGPQSEGSETDDGRSGDRLRGTSVSPVVLGTGDAESISQTIKLLWIDRIDEETPIQKHIHDRPMGHLDRDRDRACCGFR